METADVVLMADNIEKLPYTMNLSRKAITIIKQNIWFALLIKLAALILIFPGWLTLWMAVLSYPGTAIIVILNALRLLTIKKLLKYLISKLTYLKDFLLKLVDCLNNLW